MKWFSFTFLFIFSVSVSRADERDTLRVGLQADGRIVVPTNQILQPAGKQVIFPGRPVDVIEIDGGKTIVVKNLRELVLIDVVTGTVKQTLAVPTPKMGKAAGFSAVGLVANQDKIFVSDTQNQVRIAQKKADGNYEWAKTTLTLQAPPDVKGAAYPTGLALTTDQQVWVCSSRGNEVQLIDPAKGNVLTTVSVGVAPYQPIIASPTKLYVSNWGGEPTKTKNDTSSGTPIRTDSRNIANSGTVSVIEKTAEGWKQTKSIAVGLHPSGMTSHAKSGQLFVANANSDTVSIIDMKTDQVTATINCKPDAKLPFGSGANAVAVDDAGQRLYVANGTNNCIAVIDLPTKKMLGMIPTGWYPGAVRLSADGKKLYVANIKGHGSLAEKRPAPKGRNSHDHLGTVSIIDIRDDAQLKKFTDIVNANNRLGYAMAGLEKPRPNVTPVPVPERHGEPSTIEHVFYVIKENRTYDQVFGDIKEGNGDPNLCIFGEEITPNHHKLAREFTLLDNFYCSGVLSADGHQWVNEAYVVDYLEKQFGGFTRSYPYDGDDPLAYAASGFIWDNALARKKTFYNFGEFCLTTYEPKGTKWADVYQDFLNGTNKVTVNVKPTNQSIAALTHPGYPGFPLQMPDVYRAKMFQEQLAKWEKAGTLPNLIYVFLPNNHTSGTSPNWPTPRAMVADNDIALGQIVEAISKSKFWAKSCILVTEDDPQNGFDHVNGHRTIGMAISPYTKRKAVDSTCYNQTSMVKTIELMLGLPPMNQFDLTATPMRGCFTTKPDLTAYSHVKNRIPLDEMNKPISKLQGKAKLWAEKSLALDFSKEDLADEDTLNRILWFSIRGEAAYPGD